MTRDAYLVGGVRTPVGRFGGALATVRADDLAAEVVSACVTRLGLPPEHIDEVILGAANQAGEDNRNVARMATLLAGLPDRIPAYTVNRLCASGLQAIMSAAQSVRCGDADVVIAGGVESMTRAPWVMAKPGTPWGKPGEVVDTSLGWRLVNPRMRALDGGEATLTLGECTEKLARLEGITREECDAYAARSQEAAAHAWQQGFFDDEIVPVTTKAGVVDRDETVRATTVDGLAALKPSFGDGGVVTGGNASPLSDGASAIAVMSGDAVERLGLRPRARILAQASAGVEPSLFGLGPVPAIETVLTRSAVALDEVAEIEINEAFAAQVIACERRLGLDRSRVNSAGGAIALGHPLGSSGTRITMTLLGRLERAQQRYGIASLCIGVGQGAALLFERC